MAGFKQIGEVVEALIDIKDEFYSNLTYSQIDAINDACNLLSKILGDCTKYDYDYTIIGKKVVSTTPDNNTH